MNASKQYNSCSVNIEKDLVFFRNVTYAFEPLLILIFIFGTLGNLATIFTLRRKNLRNTSTSTYLTAFAVADGFYILWAVLPKILEDLMIFPHEFRELSNVWCRLHVFSVYTATYISIWVLVAVTIDRAIQVVIPFRAKELSTPHNAKIIIISIVLSFICLNSHQLLTFRLKKIEIGSQCASDYDINNLVLPWSDLIISAFLPFFLMMICSICIMVKLRMVKIARHNTFAKSCNLRSKRGESASVTSMLLATNLFFITTVTPTLVFNILMRFDVINNEIQLECKSQFYRSMTDTFAYRKYYVIKCSSLLLWYLNFSIHFMLYCFSGRRFRNEALALFGCERFATLFSSTNGHRDNTMTCPDMSSAKSRQKASSGIARQYKLEQFKGELTKLQPYKVMTDDQQHTRQPSITFVQIEHVPTERQPLTELGASSN